MSSASRAARTCDSSRSRSRGRSCGALLLIEPWRQHVDQCVCVGVQQADASSTDDRRCAMSDGLCYLARLTQDWGGVAIPGDDERWRGYRAQLRAVIGMLEQTLACLCVVVASTG